MCVVCMHRPVDALSQMAMLDCTSVTHLLGRSRHFFGIECPSSRHYASSKTDACLIQFWIPRFTSYLALRLFTLQIVTLILKFLLFLQFLSKTLHRFPGHQFEEAERHLDIPEAEVISPQRNEGNSNGNGNACIQTLIIIILLEVYSK